MFGYESRSWEVYYMHGDASDEAYQQQAERLSHISGSIISRRAPWALDDLTPGGFIVRPEFVRSALLCSYASDGNTQSFSAECRTQLKTRHARADGTGAVATAVRGGYDCSGCPPGREATPGGWFSDLGDMLRRQEVGADRCDFGQVWHEGAPDNACYNEVVCRADGPTGWYAQLPGAVQAYAVARGGQLSRSRERRDSFARYFGLEQHAVPLLFYDQRADAPFSLADDPLQ